MHLSALEKLWGMYHPTRAICEDSSLCTATTFVRICLSRPRTALSLSRLARYFHCLEGAEEKQPYCRETVRDHPPPQEAL